MKQYPTLAVIEFASIADGIYCADALLKKAPISMIKAGTASQGRYLIILGGSTAAVEESLNEALAVGQQAQVEVTSHIRLCLSPVKARAAKTMMKALRPPQKPTG